MFEQKKSKVGGFRPGSGRPVTKGRVKGEPTQMVRVPVSRKVAVKKLIETREFQVPLFSGSVRAGIPTEIPDEDYPDQIKLIDYLTDHPDETFCVRAEGDSMIDANIYEDDLLLVDKLIEPNDGCVVVVSLNNEQTVKRLKLINGKTWLYPANEDYKAIPVGIEDEFKIWGVVRKKMGEVG